MKTLKQKREDQHTPIIIDHAVNDNRTRSFAHLDRFIQSRSKGWAK